MRSSRTASSSSRPRSRRRSVAASWPIVAPRRWPRRCASRYPRTSSSCTPVATRCSCCARRCIRSPASWRRASPCKRRHGRKGPLDFRNTVRHSLSYGGVPAEPKFKYPRPAKPELLVVADISGSVAAFARFTLMLVYAIQHQFSKVVRSCSSTASTRSPITSRAPRTSARRSTGSTPRPTSSGSTATPTTVMRSRCSGSAGARTSVPSRRCCSSATPATTTTPASRGSSRRCPPRPVTCTGSTPSRGRTGTPATRSSTSTPRTPTGSTRCRNLRQLEAFVEKLA